MNVVENMIVLLMFAKTVVPSGNLIAISGIILYVAKFSRDELI